MIEPLFGSASPIAAGTPSAGFGWFQTPFGATNRGPVNIGVPGFGSLPNIAFMPQSIPQQPMSQEAYGYGGGISTVGQPGFSGLGSAVPFGLSSFSMPGGVSGFGVPEIVTAPVLLAAVAVRRGQPMGPTNDHEIEDFIYDALEFLSGTSEVEVRCEGGRATLTGSVPHKRLKRDVGEIVWAIPAINDVQNNVTITARRRARAGSRESEPHATTGRKQA
jgi:hypothetical protein